ncbi:ThiF family adenylyltransferase [Flavitalea sp. BT771]|uniref:ThiF family adenylyltransferase n=1 Tax=Flavitalea sp. BT771 TaxID=3063329 RepID=UPI0026E37123|nr:ThiF family adenylyltransferase [Flavitalea sp. BT771]MDO6433090.1 ThiF family adenylyltransferase [Flavitalea sp. BT771]MDV6221634.1 ThiF family adenylyltransferase [Flavitalea sp. BT771]
MDTHVIDRFDRQTRIRGWDQGCLQRATVMVIGAGALGNEIVKNLALMGIGNLLVVDFDKVEPSNLSRTALFSVSDIGQYKAERLAGAAKKLYPSIRSRYINGDVLFDLGLGFYRNVDLVIGGLDNLAARSHAGTYAALAGKPYLDGGVWEHGGEVKWFFPGKGACYDCLLSERDRHNMAERYSCTGFIASPSPFMQQVLPTTLAPIAIVGGIIAQEACYYFTGLRAIHPGEAIVYNGLDLGLHRSVLPENPTCLNHPARPYDPVETLMRRADDLSASELLGLAAEKLGPEVILELGRHFLVDLRCTGCGAIEEISQQIARVPEEKIHCPACGAIRRKNAVGSVGLSHALAKRSLSALGIPQGEVITVWSGRGTGFYELTGDIKKLFPN